MRINDGSRPAAATVFRRRSSHSERIRSLLARSRFAAVEPCSDRLLLLVSAPTRPSIIGPPASYAVYVPFRRMSQAAVRRGGGSSARADYLAD